MKSKLYDYRIRSEIYDRLLELYPYNNISFTDGINQLIYFGYIERICKQIQYRIIEDEL